jgi:RNA recognition motif-containing protein
MKKLYVGNLPYTTDEDEVRDLLAPFGDLKSLAMINDRDTGRFRGFCFVEMDDADANSAIEALDGKDFGGRNLRVNEAKPRENRGGGRSQGGNRDRYSGGGGYNRY